MTQAAVKKPDRIAVLIPFFNDWQCLTQLLSEIEAHTRELSIAVDILLVNDFSTSVPAADWLPDLAGNVARVRRLDLVRNMGHQRAIAVGLAKLHAEGDADAVIVMDADGEDQPSDIPRLWQKFREGAAPAVIFAEREGRSEGILFRFFYRLFRLLFLVMTGKSVRGGNFTLIPSPLLSGVVHCPDIWNHYAAAITRSRLPSCRLKTRRGQRYVGKSKMNFVALVAHGLSAISVFGELVGIRLLIATLILIALAAAAIGTTVFIRLWTDLAIPGWATYTTGLLAIILLQGVMLSFVLIFMVLNSRSVPSFMPHPDALSFISRVETLREPCPSKVE